MEQVDGERLCKKHVQNSWNAEGVRRSSASLHMHSESLENYAEDWTMYVLAMHRSRTRIHRSQMRLQKERTGDNRSIASMTRGLSLRQGATVGVDTESKIQPRSSTTARIYGVQANHISEICTYGPRLQSLSALYSIAALSSSHWCYWSIVTSPFFLEMRLTSVNACTTSVHC